MGDCGIGGMNDLVTKLPAVWSCRIGNRVGIVPVARAYAHAVAAMDGETPASPAPPGCSESDFITTHWKSIGAFHSRV